MVENKSLTRRFVENRRKHIDEDICGQILNPGDTFLVSCTLYKEHPGDHSVITTWSEPKRF